MPANHRPWLLQGSLALATLAIAVALSVSASSR